MYYAEFHPYGAGNASSDNRLMQFETVEERDEMVARLNEIHWGNGYDVCAPMTTREATRYNLRRFKSLDWSHEVCGVRTCRNRVFFEIEPTR